MTHAKACRDRPGEKNQRWKWRKDVGGELDSEIILGKNTMQARDCVPAKMTCCVVFGGIEKLIGRHGKKQVPRRFKNRMDQLESSSFIFDVFQHVEKAD